MRPLFRQLTTLQAHTAAISAASYRPDGRQILTASYDYTALIWDVSEAGFALELRGHTRELSPWAPS